jgi:hypothetical protein
MQGLVTLESNLSGTLARHSDYTVAVEVLEDASLRLEAYRLAKSLLASKIDSQLGRTGGND